jgi:hypothetical protein
MSAWFSIDKENIPISYIQIDKATIIIPILVSVHKHNKIPDNSILFGIFVEYIGHTVFRSIYSYIDINDVIFKDSLTIKLNNILYWARVDKPTFNSTASIQNKYELLDI